MINLLDYEDFIREEGNSISQKLVFEYIDNIIQKKLSEGLKSHELICTQDIRGAGKTYQLVKFAKENNLSVIVIGSAIAEAIKLACNYGKVYGQNDRDIHDMECVIDEGVDVKLLGKRLNINILTGYSNMKENICSTVNKKNEKKYFISYVAYAYTGKTEWTVLPNDSFNTIMYIDEEITSKLLEKIQENLVDKLNEVAGENKQYYSTQIIFYNEIK